MKFWEQQSFLREENASYPRPTKRQALSALLIIAILIGGFHYALSAASKTDAPHEFTVERGEGFRKIVSDLKSNGLIKSAFAFGTLSIVTGSATDMKPGTYRLSPTMSSYQILNNLIVGSEREVTVLIPEGMNVFEIDTMLSASGITQPGAFAAEALKEQKEGYVFPDTYKLFTASDPKEIIQKLTDQFNQKIATLPEKRIAPSDLILASLLEKEVPDPNDQKIVAGILKKRITQNIPLQVDATVCYGKELNDPQHRNCNPLSPADLKIDSPFNTYIHTGLPPTPIGNPGLSAMTAALHPVSSPYLFYLSDPKTGKTIFAKTFAEHIANQMIYFK